jgi:hypothetical protein
LRTNYFTFYEREEKIFLLTHGIINHVMELYIKLRDSPLMLTANSNQRGLEEAVLHRTLNRNSSPSFYSYLPPPPQA